MRQGDPPEQRGRQGQRPSLSRIWARPGGRPQEPSDGPGGRHFVQGAGREDSWVPPHAPLGCYSVKGLGS